MSWDCCKACGVVLIPNKGTKTNFCDACSERRKKDLGHDDSLGVPSLISFTYIKDYGKVEDSRLRELERRVIIPGSEKPDGTYHVGRKGENGKIQEKEPGY